MNKNEIEKIMGNNDLRIKVMERYAFSVIEITLISSLPLFLLLIGLQILYIMLIIMSIFSLILLYGISIVYLYNIYLLKKKCESWSEIIRGAFKNE